MTRKIIPNETNNPNNKFSGNGINNELKTNPDKNADKIEIHQINFGKFAPKNPLKLDMNISATRMKNTISVVILYTSAYLFYRKTKSQ